MRKIILVEGKDDKAFVEVLMPDCETREIVIDKLNGLTETSLKNALSRLRNEILKNPFDKLGIIVDYDTFSTDERLKFINKCLSEVLSVQLLNVGKPEIVIIEDFEVELSCFLVGIDQKGSLDTILQQIPTLPTTTADCLVKCLPQNLSTKEYSKAWVFYYIRWDVCNAEERKNAQKNVTLRFSLFDKKAWDIDSPHLNPFKEYLSFFA